MNKNTKARKLLALVLAMMLILGSFAACSGDKGSSSQITPDEVGGESVPEKEAVGNGILSIYTWEGMFPKSVVTSFEEETGIKVVYNNFDYNETMLTKLQNADGGDYDLVIADDYIIESVIGEGLAQKLNKAELPSLGNINPLYQNTYYDKDNEYTIPYGAGIQTIVYDEEAVSVDIKGYEDLWNEALADNVGIIANYRVINGMALKTMGESYNTEDTAKITEAGEKLLTLAPNIRVIKDDNLQDDIISGEIGAAVMYTSQVTMAKLARPELKVVYPEEGLGLGIMAGFIPSNAPNTEAAHMFLEYILDPKRAAECFEFLGYYSTNLAAEEYISDEMKEFLTIPSDFSTDKMEMIEDVPSSIAEVHEKVWTEFKAATGQ